MCITCIGHMFGHIWTCESHVSIDSSIVTMEDSNVRVPSIRVPKGTILALIAFSIQWHTAFPPMIWDICWDIRSQSSEVNYFLNCSYFEANCSIIIHLYYFVWALVWCLILVLCSSQ